MKIIVQRIYLIEDEAVTLDGLLVKIEGSFGSIHLLGTVVK